MSHVDSPGSVRAGEELDATRLAAYLSSAVPGFRGPLEVSQFAAGFSNLTYLLRAPGMEWVLRRPPFGTRPRSGHDMGREYRVLKALEGRFPQAPRALAFCDDETVIGAPFYLAERIRGIILRREYPGGIAPAPSLVRAQQEALADGLARLHAVDFKAAGLVDLGQPEGYVRRQVEGWSRRFERASTDDAPAAGAVLDWLQTHLPEESANAVLLHNDYKLDNVVFDSAQPARLIGVLDWEMTTLGDPRMDVGCSLAYWIQADDPPWLAATRTLPTHLPGSMRRIEFVQRYADAAGLDECDWNFFHAFGLFRLAVVAQQIYLRYRLGQTRDARFAALGPMVHALIRAAGMAAGGELLRGGSPDAR